MPNKHTSKRQLGAILSVLMLAALLTGCAVPWLLRAIDAAQICQVNAVRTVQDLPQKAAAPGSRAIYWYVCGSDLESNAGLAGKDLAELCSVTLPDNITVAVQTGGSSKWTRKGIRGDRIGRYTYTGNKWPQVQSLPNANMGEAQTLDDFLRWCRYDYPAEHEVLLFWGHGGGVLGGLGYDENYGYDCLTVQELSSGILYDSRRAAPFTLVGVDSCMMANLESVLALSHYGDAAKYIVASQSVEPGFGWDYAAWMQALADTPTMDGVQLGKAICDSYIQACEARGVEEQATLSLIDADEASNLSFKLEDYSQS